MANINVKTLLGLFLILSSCVSDGHYPNAVCWNRKQVEAKELQGRVINFDEPLLSPNQLITYDSVLITFNTRVEKMFHLFSLSSHQKLGERITFGQGATDMMMPTFVRNQKQIELFDMANSTIHIFDVSDFVKDEAPQAKDKIQLDKRPIWSEIGKLGDQYIAVSYKPETPCYLFSKEGSSISDFGHYPESQNICTNQELIDTYRAILTTNGKDRVAVCHFFTDLIDIYDAKGNLIKELHGPDRFYTKFNEFHEGERIGSNAVPETHRDAFYSPVGTQDKLYVLYNGKFINQEGYNLLATEIFVFDWNGKPLERYSLDQGVSRITVDEKSRTIYGISNDPEMHLVAFNY